MKTIAVDTGGTFTDLVLWSENRLCILKVPSTPSAPEQAVLNGVRRLLGDDTSGEPFTLLHGTTVGTNRILERKGARTAFLTTQGFRDLLHLARQDRMELYALCPRPRPCLAERALCAEVPERVAYDGTVLKSLDTSNLNRLIRQWKRAGVEAVAVCLLFSYANPSHERKLKRLLEPHFAVSLSSEVAPEFREYERASTTFLNAYLIPPMRGYLEALETGAQSLGATQTLISHSAGGLMGVPLASALPITTVLSGPSAGVMGAWALARQTGFSRVLTLDMGGTSTDMALIDREPLRTSLGEIEGMPIRLPRLDIHTIGAGGGSLAYLDPAGGLRVGPQSAGADPGPALYGKGDQPTLTDAHAALGHLLRETFGFGQFELQMERAFTALEPLARALGLSLHETAQAILDQARAKMARGLRTISSGRGISPESCTLLVFGGAGGLHLCALARLVGIRQWVVPPYPGVLSAYGLLWMDRLYEAVRTVLTPLPQSRSIAIEQVLLELRAECESVMGTSEGLDLQAYADLRYQGQSHELTVPFDPANPPQSGERFVQRHQERYGFTLPDRPIELVNLRLRAVILQPKPAGALWEPVCLDKLPDLPTHTTLWLEGEQVEVPVLTREGLLPHRPLPTPALLVQPDTTVLLEAGWEVMLDPRTGALVGRWNR